VPTIPGRPVAGLTCVKLPRRGGPPLRAVTRRCRIDIARLRARP